jgi:hypothetical protein
MVGSNVSSVALHPRTLVPIHLGYRPDASSELLAGARHLGLLDEVSIYNRPLAPAEIRLIYNAGAAGKKLPLVPLLTRDLVSCWRGEENARDSFGHNHGELIGGVSFAPGKMGQGFLFNGSNSYVRIPHDRSLELSNEFTVEFWYKDTGCPPGHHFYGLIANRATYPAGANFGINLYMGNPMQLQAYLQDPMYPSYQISSSPAPGAGVFHHVAVTYTQMTPELVEMKTYVDGQLVHTSDSPGNIGRTINTAPVFIGSSNPDEELFVGLIDEPAIYRRALSAAQILAIYDAGTAGERLPTNVVNSAPPFKPGSPAGK